MAKVVNQQGEVIGTVVQDQAIVGDVVTTINKDLPLVRQDLKAIRNYATDNSLGVNTRTLEKLLVYGAGIVGATNGFAQLAMPNTVRVGLMSISAFIIAALHVSG